MTAARAAGVVMVLAAGLVVLVPIDIAAQGRARGADRGPAFCRSGEGHPVFGWRWCEERGWDREWRGVRRTAPARGDTYSDRRPFPRREARGGVAGVAFDNGYADGYEKGVEDRRGRRAYDPVRHRWYREGDRGYDRRDGSRAQYQNVYREGFRGGYDAGHRGVGRSEPHRGGVRFPWPF